MITREDIEKRFLTADLQAITSSDMTIVDRAISSALIWLKANLERLGISYDKNSEWQKEIAIKRTLYEIYAYAQDWEIAKENREEAEKMLEARFSSSDSEVKRKVLVAAVKEGSNNWRGYQ